MSYAAEFGRCCTWCYTLAVPTDKPRYTITSDPDIERALRRCKARFPGTADSKLLARLIKRGDEAIEADERAEAEQEERRAAAAERLAERFSRADGFDYEALSEASTRWSRG